MRLIYMSRHDKNLDLKQLYLPKTRLDLGVIFNSITEILNLLAL